jgi:ferrous iron transport protein A
MNSRITSLAQLKAGDRARVVAGANPDNAHLRLLELGLVPGEIFTVLKEAPLGDPIEIRLMNYELCLRKREASAILVELVSVDGGDVIDASGGRP